MSTILKVISYTAPNKKEPFIEWFETLDFKVQAIVLARLDRIVLGNFGDCKSLKDGIWELRIQYGAGYRIYFGKYQNKIVVLLVGGDKSSQNKDIAKAKKYWLNYRDNNE